MRKILLFPGAFNPPHYGHIEAIEIALKKSKKSFDELWVMPSGRRDDKTITTTYENRRALGTLFVEYLKPRIGIPVKLVTAELDDKSGKFTHEILKEIKSQPDMQATQLIGLDGFLSIKDGLFGKEESFIIIKRKGYELPENFSHGSNIIIFNKEAKPISSTQICNMVKNHDDGYKKLVPKKISDYIEKHKLYF